MEQASGWVCLPVSQARCLSPELVALFSVLVAGLGCVHFTALSH